MSTQGGHGQGCGESSGGVARAALHWPQCARAGTRGGTHMLDAAGRRAGGGVCAFVCDNHCRSSALARQEKLAGLAPPSTSSHTPGIIGQPRSSEEEEEGRRGARTVAPPAPPTGDHREAKKRGANPASGSKTDRACCRITTAGMLGEGPPQSSQSTRVSNVAARLLAALPTLRSQCDA